MSSIIVEVHCTQIGKISMSRRESQFSSYLVKGPVFARFTLPDKVAGSVIGRAGQVLQEFEQSTGAQIKVSPSKTYFPTTNERTIIICGEDRPVKMGLPFLLRKLQEHGQDVRSMFLKMIIPNGSIPNIIGKGGEVVRSIQSRTGASVHLCERIEGISETILELKGSEDSIINAGSELIDIIQGDPKLKEIAGEYYASFQGPPSRAPPQRSEWQDSYSRREESRDGYPRRDERVEPPQQRRDDRYDSYQKHDDWQGSSYRQERQEQYAPPRREERQPAHYAPPAQPIADPTTNPALLAYPMSIEFVVPVLSVNNILGEKGAHVEHVFNSTGAEVTVSHDSGDPNSLDATIRITGPLCGVQAAHILVIKQVTDAIMAAESGPN